LYVLRSLSEPCDSWIKVRRGVEREEKIREEKRREEKKALCLSSGAAEDVKNTLNCVPVYVCVTLSDLVVDARCKAAGRGAGTLHDMRSHPQIAHLRLL
jgi:hypothetical protein